MLLKFNSININIEPGLPDGNKDVVLFLHGFTGSSKEWDDVIPLIHQNYDCIALDLIGHGKSDSPDNPDLYSSASILNQINEVLNRLKLSKIILAGYSMGGRAALSFAAVYPEKIKTLILESASPGIKDKKERELRKRSDEDLAAFIKKNDIKTFIEYWMNIDLFESQKKLPEEKLKKQFEEKLKNNTTGLANSLLGFGTGVMPHLFDKIKTLDFPVLLLTGGLDKKFTNINRNILASFPAAGHKIILTAGHNIHFEQPHTFAEVINHFLLHK